MRNPMMLVTQASDLGHHMAGDGGCAGGWAGTSRTGGRADNGARKSDRGIAETSVIRTMSFHVRCHSSPGVEAARTSATAEPLRLPSAVPLDSPWF